MLRFITIGFSLFLLSAVTWTGTASAQLPNGDVCVVSGDCDSGFCVDGVCCESDCTDACSFCATSGSEGTCGPVTGAPLGGRTGCMECAAGTCIDLNALGDACTIDSECGSGHCTDGFCCERACTGTCKSCGEPGEEGECVPVSGAPRGDRTGCSTCDTGVCVDTGDGSLGSICTVGDDCDSEFCVDGVCCERACAGVCKACGEPGSEGMCTPVDGAPRGDREGCATCDGGACADVPLQPLGESCTSAMGCESGHCVDGVCCERACRGLCKACGEPGEEGLCIAIDGAPRGDRVGCAECDSGVCVDVGLSVLGASCGEGSECDSGFCVDGVCCENTCGEACNACAEPGTEGMCTPVSGPARGDRVAACATSCTEGVCTDGEPGSACAVSEECISGFCADGVCCERDCDGTCRACAEPGQEGQCVLVSGAPRGDRTGCATCNEGVCAGFEPTGDECDVGTDCASGRCTDGFCCERYCRGGCKSCGEPGLEGECAPISGDPRGDRDLCIACNEGRCVGFESQGALCVEDTDCASGYCTDGVCCERECRGPCRACAEPGSEGSCVPVTGTPRSGREGCTTCSDGACVEGADAAFFLSSCELGGDCFAPLGVSDEPFVSAPALRVPDGGGLTESLPEVDPNICTVSVGGTPPYAMFALLGVLLAWRRRD